MVKKRNQGLFLRLYLAPFRSASRWANLHPFRSNCCWFTRDPPQLPRYRWIYGTGLNVKLKIIQIFLSIFSFAYSSVKRIFRRGSNRVSEIRLRKTFKRLPSRFIWKVSRELSPSTPQAAMFRAGNASIDFGNSIYDITRVYFTFRSRKFISFSVYTLIFVIGNVWKAYVGNININFPLNSNFKLRRF